MAEQLYLFQPGGQIIPPSFLLVPPNILTFRRACMELRFYLFSIVDYIALTKFVFCIFFYKLNIPTDAGTMATEVIKKKVRKLILKMCINTIVIFPRYFTE